jgi:eukaryotic-like serine/threonine-protein kinase
VSADQPDRAWVQVKEIAGDALELPASQREAFIVQRCSGDAELLAGVRRLLMADAAAGAQFLDPPSISITAPAQQAGTDAGLLVGKRIGRYRLKRLIGVGGMGAVYEAVQDQPRRTVALKVMRSGIASRSSLRRFEFEAQLLGRLRHPGIAQVFEAGTHEALTGPVPYFAMEFIPGAASITEFVKIRRLTTEDRLKLFARVCDAVHHGHQKGIVHRDLKPSNILVDSSGDPKIIDFGVARATDSDMVVTTLQTDLGQLVGTLQYMSPEQCAADPSDIDTRSDVYALGIVLYELLTGQLPYNVTRSDLYEAARIIREEPPARLSSIDRTLRGDLETITLKAVEKDRARRYQSAAELGGDIHRYLRGEPIQARPASVGYQVRILARRHKALIAIVIAIATGLVLAVIGTGIGLYRTMQERDRVRLAEIRAREETRRAQAAAEFLRETLLSANPLLMVSKPPSDEELEYAPWEPLLPRYLQYAGKPGKAASVADVLEAAGARLASSFPHDGVTRADMLHLIGNTLVYVGRPLQGAELLRQSLSTRQRTLGPTASETIATAVHAAEIYSQFGNFSGAVSLLQPAYDAAREAYGPTDPRTLHVSRNLTTNLMRLPERRAEALQHQARILAELSQAGMDARPRSFIQQGHMALLLLDSGELEEAERFGRAAVAGLRGLDEAPRQLADASLWLSRILTQRGKFEEAEPLGAKSLAYYIGRYGPDHPHVGEIRKQRIQLLAALGRFEEAESVAREMTHSEERMFGPESLPALKAEARLARILLLRGTDARQAEERARFATDFTMMLNGVQEDYAVYHATTLASAHVALGGARLALEILEARRRNPPQNAPWVLGYLHTVEGEAHTALGDYERAATSLDHARGLVEQNPDPTHLNRLNWLRARAALADARGETELASTLRAALPGAAK